MYEEAKIKFEVYTNYLWGLSYYIKQKYPSYSDIKSVVKISQKDNISCSNIEEVRKFLFNSWNSERILNAPTEYKTGNSFLKFANHWSPVLGYYSIFLCFQSLLIAANEGVILRHEVFLEKVSSYIKKQKFPFIYPWDILCDGCSYYKAENFNFTVDRGEILTLSSLCNPSRVNEAVFMAKILRTTRTKQESYREGRWKEEGRFRTKKEDIPKKNYGRKEKLAVSQSIAPTSIFNFLYRLRLRSNYEDADIFFLGDRDESDVNNYFFSLQNITSYTLFFIETIIRQLVGDDLFYMIIESFDKMSGSYKQGIIARRECH